MKLKYELTSEEIKQAVVQYVAKKLEVDAGGFQVEVGARMESRGYGMAERDEPVVYATVIRSS